MSTSPATRKPARQRAARHPNVVPFARPPRLRQPQPSPRLTVRECLDTLQALSAAIERHAEHPEQVRALASAWGAVLGHLHAAVLGHLHAAVGARA